MRNIKLVTNCERPPNYLMDIAVKHWFKNGFEPKDLIFLVNNILDPVWEWPMTTSIFQKHLENKYGSIAIAKSTIHHYEYIWSERVEVTGTADPIPEQFVEVDYATYLTINEDLKRIIYAYEYELDLNESHRKIQLIQPLYASQVLTESRGMFR